MTAQELLIRQANRNYETLAETVRAFPKDKLDWQPSPESRSALDQLQEVATIQEMSGDDIYEKRKLEVDMEAFGKWQESSKQHTDPERLLAMIKAATEHHNEVVARAKDEDLLLPFEMPWPGDFTLVDVLAYHQWNMAYHDAQINYLAAMLGASDEAPAETGPSA